MEITGCEIKQIMGGIPMPAIPEVLLHDPDEFRILDKSMKKTIQDGSESGYACGKNQSVFFKQTTHFPESF
jgi:hypothetical protein